MFLFFVVFQNKRQHGCIIIYFWNNINDMSVFLLIGVLASCDCTHTIPPLVPFLSFKKNFTPNFSRHLHHLAVNSGNFICQLSLLKHIRGVQTFHSDQNDYFCILWKWSADSQMAQRQYEWSWIYPSRVHYLCRFDIKSQHYKRRTD